MADSAGQAPAGWYDDPHAPGRMRYFDGHAWTEHYHQPGSLPDLGSWFNTSFSAVGAYWQGAVLLALGTTLISNFVIWFGLKAIVQDVVITNEAIEGFSAARAFGGMALVVFALVWQGFGWISLNRFLQRANFQANPTIEEALRHAVTRLPKYIGFILGMIVVIILAAFVLALLGTFVPVLGILVALLLIPAMVYGAVKIWFITPAIAAAPAEASALRSSAGVSAGRFWSVFGRVLLVSIVIGVGSTLLGSIFGPYGSPLDQQQLSEQLQVVDGEFVMDRFVISDVMPSGATFVIALVVASVVRAATSLVSTAVFMRLYLDSGAPSDLDA